MEKQYSFDLTQMKRFLNFPFQLRVFGYLPNNFHPPHKNRKESMIIGMFLGSRGGRTRLFRPEQEKVYELHPPVFSICKKGTLTWSEHEQPWDEIYFCYSGETEERFRAAGLDPDRPPEQFVITRNFEKRKEELLSLCRLIHLPGTVDRLDMAAYQLIMEAVLPREDFYLPEIRNQTIARIATHLQKNFMHKINLDELLKHHGISRRNFYREWSRVFPLPVHQFLLEQRLGLARQLLRATIQTSADIADECGFANGMDFCRTFRKQFGLTPLEYRNQFQKTEIFPVR